MVGLCMPSFLMRTPRCGRRWRIALSVMLALTSSAAHAAICTWQATASAIWNDPLNWSGCALGGGAPAGTPGPLDRAVLPSGTGTAILSAQFISIAELEMAAGTALALNPALTNANNRQLTVTGSAQLTGATLSGALPPPGGPFPASLILRLSTAATLTLMGANTLRRAVVLNGGSAMFVGGSGARLDLDLNGRYVNELTGITTTLGDFVYGYSSSGVIENQGHWIVQGPGLAQVQRSGASGGQFASSGLFEVLSGTFKQLNPSAGFQSSFAGSSVRLVDGILDAGTQEVVIDTDRFLSGSGSVIGPVRISGGKLDLDSGTGAIGALSITGELILPSAELVLDVEGPGLSQHDRMSVSGPAQLTRARTTVRIAPGYAPGIDTSIPIITHASFQSLGQPTNAWVLSEYPLSLMLRGQPTHTDLRVVPTLLIADSAQHEGNTGSQNMTFQATLSAPSTESVSFSHTLQPGTAVSVATLGFPADYNNTLGNISSTVNFAPGSTERLVHVVINGDIAVEGNEAFVLMTGDTSASTLQNASFGNGRRFFARAEGRILDDELLASAYLLIGKDANSSTATGQVSFIRRYSTSGQAIDSWESLVPNTFGASATGFCTAPDGDVLSTRFGSSQGAMRMTPAGAVRDPDFGGLIGNDESCSFDVNGNAWIGDAAPDAVSGFGTLRQVSASGRLLKTIKIPVGERAVDWLELDADQCTLYYSSEDTDVRRFNICTQLPMPHFASALAGPCFTMRQRSNGELLLACRNQIERFAQSGAPLSTYSLESLGETDAMGFFALTLDPDGSSFWTGGKNSGRVVKARIDTGAVLTSFLTGLGGVNGLLIENNVALSAQLLKDGFE